MHRSGHVGIALLFVTPLAFIVATVYGIEIGIGTLALGVSASDLPDRDQQIPGLSHRGFSHTVWAALVVAGLGGIGGFFLSTKMASSPPIPIPGIDTLVSIGPILFAGLTALAILFGYLSHIVGDILTVGSAYFGMDIKPLFPLTEASVQLGIAKADSMMWNSIFFVLGVVATAGVFVFN
ncbi:metal-dependent hydrolase [Halodesulfurarchaeum sp. HSR-GB]|uniref:metal-dependent hydrolase n=1 Tax=Halodesulfurarchaeum sp. HSR-GB TaxID=3074077 RepID=UPI00285F1EC0|nr:metal-dependent hydrolase [Halodesulfurarchaeum sp. HSR-GB]MDR5657754.1 metal-dependent hydrolase [Halodesulfurarchaeum sp. HSR-GB]